MINFETPYQIARIGLSNAQAYAADAFADMAESLSIGRTLAPFAMINETAPVDLVAAAMFAQIAAEAGKDLFFCDRFELIGSAVSESVGYRHQAAICASLFEDWQARLKRVESEFGAIED